MYRKLNQQLQQMKREDLEEQMIEHVKEALMDQSITLKEMVKDYTDDIEKQAAENLNIIAKVTDESKKKLLADKEHHLEELEKAKDEHLKALQRKPSVARIVFLFLAIVLKCATAFSFAVAVAGQDEPPAWFEKAVAIIFLTDVAKQYLLMTGW